MEKEIILEKISSQKQILKEKYHVKNIGVFGSIIRNEQTKDSDADILIEFDSPVGFFEFIRLEIFLSRLIGRKADLITKRAVKPAIKADIFKEVVYV